MLVTTSRTLAEETLRQVAAQLEDLPTAEIAARAWEDFGEIVVVDSDEEALELADAYAFEHVEIQTANPRWYLERMRNYGALFLGEATTVAYGDKTIGTNHILPTGGAARYTGGLWVGKFLKTVTFQECDEDGERDDRRDLRPPVPDRELRGPRAQLRRPRGQVPRSRCSSREETA